MGHRANYAIRRDDDVELFYSHWGALTVPQNFFWGPKYADAFIRTHTACDPKDDWLDEAWGEGGVALDYDDKVITMFGGEALGHPPLRATFTALMAALWRSEGWDVVWAESGMPAIASAVGVDPALVVSEPIPPFVVDLDEFGTSFQSDEPTFGCLLSIVEDGDVSHHVADAIVCNTLFTGPVILEHLDDMVTLEKAETLWHCPDYRTTRWGLGDELSHSAIIDLDHERIAFRDEFAEKATTQFLQEKWVGWEVEYFGGPLDRHFSRLGLPLPPSLVALEEERSDPSEVELTEEAALAEVAKYLIDSPRKDPSEIVRQMENETGRPGHEVVVSAEAARPAGSPELDARKRQALFGKAIALMKYLS